MKKSVAVNTAGSTRRKVTFENLLCIRSGFYIHWTLNNMHLNFMGSFKWRFFFNSKYIIHNPQLVESRDMKLRHRETLYRKGLEYMLMRIFNCTECQHLNPQVVEGSTVYQISFFSIFLYWLCITPILSKTLICKVYLGSVKFISAKLYFTKLNNYCGYS